MVDTGTLLSEDDVQPLIPVSKLIDLGCTMSWGKDRCRIDHIQHGAIPILMEQGCPTVDLEWGRRLMQEVEEMEQRRSKLRAVLHCGVLAETPEEKEVASLVSTFPEAPLRILERAVSGHQWDAMPATVEPEAETEDPGREGGGGAYVLGGQHQEVEDSRPTGNADPVCGRATGRESSGPTRGRLPLGAGEVRQDQSVVEWPPMQNSVIGKAQGRRRARTNQIQEWRRKVRAARETRRQCRRRRITMPRYGLKNLWLIRQARKGNPELQVLIEQPQDPEEWAVGEMALERPKEGFPSFLAWVETKDLIRDLNLTTVRLDQGSLGHATRKPTSLVTNIEMIQAMDGMRMSTEELGRGGRAAGETLEQRLESTRALAEWAPGLVEMLIRSAQTGPSVRALTAQERKDVESWKRHCEAGHLPFRRDCGTCLEAAGKDRPRRRVQCPESSCMAIDLSGPFPEGKDQFGPKPRYIMVATITIPVGKDVGEELPMVEGLRALDPRGRSGRSSGRAGSR